MNVAFETDSVVIGRVWFDPRDGEIHAEIAGMDHSIPLEKIPDDDVESSSPIIAFETGCAGTVVVCRHQDGQETWRPGGFTPSNA